MKAAQISSPGGAFEIVERDTPEPGPGQVRIRVEACGVCHSDAFVKEGLRPGIQYPRVPGLEVAGLVDKVGDGVITWQVGQRVGVGWHGGHCFVCDPCRDGDFINCDHSEVTGLTHDGGYAEYMVTPDDAVAAIPDGLSSAEAAPLLCAGITVYNALRHSGARPGDRVAVEGIGGLGHLGVQFADKMGFEVIAISGGSGKRDLALKLGADHYIDRAAADAAEVLTKMGGAHVILITAPNGQAATSLLGGLARNGRMVVVAASQDPIQVQPMHLIGGRKSIQGWASGVANDWEDTLKFAALTGVRAMVEEIPLDRAADAYARMMSNEARFRMVLIP